MLKTPCNPRIYPYNSKPIILSLILSLKPCYLAFYTSYSYRSFLMRSPFCQAADILLPTIKDIEISIANKFASGTRARKRLLLWLEFLISVDGKESII